ncbi:MAG: hypothetical protein J7647_13410 [Cyanobacteria bacterium SBLK]|nr:hypothetical protein [Cyanobacteria bacterium SBLK]
MFSRASIPKSLARLLAIALLFIAFFVADIQPSKADSVYSSLDQCTNIFSGAVSSKDTMRVSIIDNCKECVSTARSRDRAKVGTAKWKILFGY